MMKAIWLHGWHITVDPLLRINAFLDKIEGVFTDVFVQVQDDGHTPVTLIGPSSLAHVTTVRVNGVTPLEYLAEQAHLRGIRVHAWFVIGVGLEWSCLLDPIPQTDMLPTQNGAYGGWWLDFAKQSVRDKVAGLAADFMAHNPGLDGLHLDYLRYGLIEYHDPAEVTAMFADLRAVTDKPVSATTTTMEASRQDVEAWDALGLDWLVVMNYYAPVADRHAYLQGLSLTNASPLIGVICQNSTPAQFEADLIGFSDLGYDDFAVFAASWLTDEYLLIFLENTMPAYSDLTVAVDAIEQQTAQIRAEVASITAALDLIDAQVTALRQLATELQQADQLADQLADLL